MAFEMCIYTFTVSKPQIIHVEQSQEWTSNTFRFTDIPMGDPHG